MTTLGKKKAFAIKPNLHLSEITKIFLIPTFIIQSPKAQYFFDITLLFLLFIYLSVTNVGNKHLGSVIKQIAFVGFFIPLRFCDLNAKEDVLSVYVLYSVFTTLVFGTRCETTSSTLFLPYNFMWDKEGG